MKGPLYLRASQGEAPNVVMYCLRWPNTVFARAFADAILPLHKDFKKQACRQ